MTASVRGQLGVGIAALITAALGSATAAENLPTLRIDPALLGPFSTSTVKPAEEAAPVVVTPPPELLPIAPSDPGSSSVQPAPASTSAAATPGPSSVQNPAPQREPSPAPKLQATEQVEAVSAPIAPALLPAHPQPESPPPTAPVTAVPVRQEEEGKPESGGGSGPSNTLSGRPSALTPTSTAPTTSSLGAASTAAAPATSITLAPLASQAGSFKKVPHDPNAKAPIYVTADSITGTTDQAIIAEGKVELQQNDATLTADKVTYWQTEDETEADGNVVLTRPNAHISGPKMRLRIEDNEGYADQPIYTIKHEVVRREPQPQDMAIAKPLHPSMPDVTAPQRVATTGSGKAERIDFEGEGQYHLHDATYSTCPADDQTWYAQATDLKLDYDSETGHGSNARLYFKSVPFLYTPVISFPLDNRRKTGLLPPTAGANSKVGLQYLQPFYWDIAPNMDATITTRLMSRRGLQLDGKFRYLDYNYSGNANLEYLPNDSVTGESRYAYSVIHNQNFGDGFTGALNLSGVSDSTYFTDLSTLISNVSQVNLLRQGVVSYSASWWSSSLSLESYQTLQIPDEPPVAIPYARLPRILLNASRPDLPGGLVFGFQGEYVNFSHPTLVEGQRVSAYPQLSLPLQTSALYLTPKIGVSATSYSLADQGAGQPTSINRTLPIYSVDSGATYERDMQWQGHGYTQTLEPRLYYVYIPYRDQSNIPVFDTALADFNFDQIFSENRYVGNDRIGDTNQLTAALTSRLIDPETGVELVRGMLGQRYYFDDQRVTLPGETPRTSSIADILASVTGLVAPKTYVDTTWEYSPNDGQTEQLNIMTRYQPELGKVLNAGYRYTRDLLGQIDISGQWPLGGGWSGMGRYNFATDEGRLIEGVAGFEYNGGCWAIRGLLQRLSTTAQSQTTTFFIQLELSGFSSIGSNPASVLRRTVPGYSHNYGTTAEDDNSNYY